MIFDIGLFMFLFYLTIPTVLGYCAHAYGKKFWPWFIYGSILPGLSQFHLILVLHLEDKRRKRELRMTFEEEKHMDKLIRESLHKKDKSRFRRG